jgi:PASTA domain
MSQQPPPGWGHSPPQPPQQRPPTQPQWGPPPPPKPTSKKPWYKRPLPVIGAIVVVLLLLGGLFGDDNQPSGTATRQTSPPPTTAPPPPTITAPPRTTIRMATVPRLVGMRTGQAKTALSRRGLHWTIKHKSTGRFAPGTVISQSSTPGAEVRPGASVALVIAKAPPPPPTTAPPPPTTAAPRNCDPAYPDVCLHQGIGDYECAGGSGNGPNYVEGPLRVFPPDPFDLDGNDNDGIGCESG